MLCESFANTAAKDGEKVGDWEFALAVNFYEDRTVCLGVNLNPYAAGRNDFRTEELLAADEFRNEKGTEGARELRHDGAFNAGNDKGAVRGHHRHVREENILTLFNAKRLVGELHGHLEGSFVGAHVLASEVLVVLRLAKLEAVKRKRKLLTGVVGNWRKLFKKLTETLFTNQSNDWFWCPTRSGNGTAGVR